MKIAIIGGGLTGLTIAYYLSKKNYKVFVFEKSENFGGLASGFKKTNWTWSLEYGYHHLFSNDNDIISFSREIGFNKIFFSYPKTASLYEEFQRSKKVIYKIYPLDSPFDLIKFPSLSVKEKIFSGLTLTFLKFSPFLKIFETQTSNEFLIKLMGKKSYQILFQELFRKKFGKYAGKILASFIWARIKKRTRKLGYFEGGFQSFIDYLSKKTKQYGANLIKNIQINEVRQEKEKFLINGEVFDIVISTLPSPVTAKIAGKIFPAYFTQNLRKINYLGAMTLILESKKPFLDKTYWLNISTKKIPIMVIVEHTNFINKKYYGENHIIYLGWYLDSKDRKIKMNCEELFNYLVPYLKKINPNFIGRKSPIIHKDVFYAPFAQPIFDKNFLRYKPDFKTPVKNFFIANLEMTYPYDRGTNYAIKIGKNIVNKILADNLR